MTSEPCPMCKQVHRVGVVGYSHMSERCWARFLNEIKKARRQARRRH